MTLTAFIPFGKKPTKNPAAMLCKYTGMREHAPRDGSNIMWDFRGMGGRLGVQLIDLRDDMSPGNDEWAQTVGWDYNWAIAVRILDRKRTDSDYIYWHSLAIVLARSYDLDNFWLDSGTDTPQEAYAFDELLPELKSSEAEDMIEWPEEGEGPLPLPDEFGKSEVEDEPEAEPVEEDVEEDVEEGVEEDVEEDVEEVSEAEPVEDEMDEGDFWGDDDDDWDSEPDEDEGEDESDDVEFDAYPPPPSDLGEDEDEDESDEDEGEGSDEAIRDPEPVTDW